ncbi:hypothetical protein PPTG_23460 [Phytophthora nicotianae INRA-310]|uniref:Uncharacterized protein n=1 Tax=Phytophthora nicotianae (strain INRA-310) TaxID=761204 RepID=W2PYC9_PHYN3|nr:hypothetical protein PPTG_23460 [Phytophthora nicotianae INRA-310]ETN05887.1 hypothetical protein PPTG_23460 [Phytophthora nicotianae INRA-310]
MRAPRHRNSTRDREKAELSTLRGLAAELESSHKKARGQRGSAFPNAKPVPDKQQNALIGFSTTEYKAMPTGSSVCGSYYTRNDGLARPPA